MGAKGGRWSNPDLDPVPKEKRTWGTVRLISPYDSMRKLTLLAPADVDHVVLVSSCHFPFFPRWTDILPSPSPFSSSTSFRLPQDLGSVQPFQLGPGSFDDRFGTDSTRSDSDHLCVLSSHEIHERRRVDTHLSSSFLPSPRLSPLRLHRMPFSLPPLRTDADVCICRSSPTELSG